jgi:hypothetical protein
MMERARISPSLTRRAIATPPATRSLTSRRSARTDRHARRDRPRSTGRREVGDRSGREGELLMARYSAQRAHAHGAGRAGRPSPRGVDGGRAHAAALLTLRSARRSARHRRQRQELMSPVPIGDVDSIASGAWPSATRSRSRPIPPLGPSGSRTRSTGRGCEGMSHEVVRQPDEPAERSRPGVPEAATAIAAAAPLAGGHPLASAAVRSLQRAVGNRATRRILGLQRKPVADEKRQELPSVKVSPSGRTEDGGYWRLEFANWVTRSELVQALFKTGALPDGAWSSPRRRSGPTCRSPGNGRSRGAAGCRSTCMR